jgi:hypothetical protein
MQLNLVLHGTWGIENNPEGIRLVTIDDHHHVIKAGRGDDPGIDLSQIKYYRLSGVTEGGANFKGAQNITIDPRNELRDDPRTELRADVNKVKVIIDLPFPREIHSVRRYKTNRVPFFSSEVPRTPPEIAATQVLVYDVPDIAALRLFPLNVDWNVLVNPNVPDVTNLHLFAEPDNQKLTEIVEQDAHAAPGHMHFQEIMRELGEAFGISIEATKMVDVPLGLEDPIPGVAAQDTAALFERANGAAVSPANCDMLMLANRPVVPPSGSAEAV